MSLEQFSPLMQRLIASSIVIVVVFLTIYFSKSPVFMPFVPAIAALIIGLALKEYYGLAKLKGLHPREKTGIALTVIYIFAIYLSARSPFLDLFPLFTLGVALIVLFATYCVGGRDPFVNIAVTLFGILYLSIPLGCLVQINNFFPVNSAQDGRWWLFYLLAVAYATDCSAYFFGKTFGRTKLAPSLSPKKTWEGAAGGFAAAILVSLGFAMLANSGQIQMHFSYSQSLLLGSLVSILAQIGDLTESLLKRDVGVKDSSNIPGLGGVLDVIDSLVFATPLVYLYLRVVHVS